MKLSDIANQIFIDPRKLTAYALDMDNPIGVDKAIMFQKHLGLTKDNFQVLLEQIETQAMNAEAIKGVLDQHGQRYQVDLSITGVEAGQQEIVRTGWIVRPGEDLARLVTLYVRRQK